jgi:hypothetical protein
MLVPGSMRAFPDLVPTSRRGVLHRLLELPRVGGVFVVFRDLALVHQAIVDGDEHIKWITLQIDSTLDVVQHQPIPVTKEVRVHQEPGFAPVSLGHPHVSVGMVRFGSPPSNTRCRQIKQLVKQRRWMLPERG